ncbi:MAG: hypothetical protein ACI4QA_07505 [Candidatus Spyradosoma sp.]
MFPVPAAFLPVAVFALAFAAGTARAFAAGVVKNADLGGYRVVVEGGGVEERKEIQYDANGNVIYDSRGVLFRNLERGTVDDSLLGDGGLDLNLDPTAESADEPVGIPEIAVPADAPETAEPAAETAAEPEEAAPAPSRSPWAVSPKALAEARKILAERRAAAARARAEQARLEAEKARRAPAASETAALGAEDDSPASLSDDSVFVDPRNALVSQPMTEDGRKMPFYLQRGDTDVGVDPSGGLKNFMKINERYVGGVERETYELERNEGYDNVIAMKEWHSKYSTLGVRRTDRYDVRTERYDSRLDAPETLERRLLDNSLMWERSREAQISVNDALARRLVERYTTGTAAGKYDLRLPAPGERTGLSMQDLNRYQFRRSHSTEAGLPVVQPAGGLKNLPQ